MRRAGDLLGLDGAVLPTVPRGTPMGLAVTALLTRLRALAEAAATAGLIADSNEGEAFAVAEANRRLDALRAALDPATVTALLDVADALEEIAGPSVAATASHSYDAAYRRCRSIAERALAALRRLDAAGGG